MRSRWNVLIVDDEAVSRESLGAWLREEGYKAETATSGTEALAKAREKEYAVYLVDLRMPQGPDGIETMRALHALDRKAAVVIITAYATVNTAIEAMKAGAVDYIVKPCNPEEISLLLDRLFKVRSLERENVLLRRRLARTFRFHDLVSKSEKMLEIFELVKRIGNLRSTVLIEGDSGTGKELIAQAIHASGDRAKRPFVGVSCGALAETLLESELFGYEKGAFTGALSQRMGKFELADGGTIFLDEIGDIPPKLQMDLLRVLQERRFFRLGGVTEIDVDVRVIAASRIDLRQQMREGRFRDDLFYRLNVINIRIPPLRERKEDIPLLARHFIERFNAEMGKEIEDVSEGAMRMLLDADWPGNVRELENAVERAMVTARGGVLLEDNLSFLADARTSPEGWVPPRGLSLLEVERRVVEATLADAGGNVSAAAETLGIDRSTLYDKIRRHKIQR